MPYNISEKIQKWTLQASTTHIDFNEIHAAIEDLISKRFNQYLPTTGPHPDFRTRLAHWLEQVNEEDQKVLLQLIPYIFFIGREEFSSLHRTAFRSSIIKWLINQLNIQFVTTDLDSQLEHAIGETWFCSITDWDLGNFYRVNGISSSVGLRPDFTTLTTLSSSSQLTRFMTSQGLRRLVLLEDFVGSGSQMAEITPLISSLPSSIPVLIVPLVICPGGIRTGQTLKRTYPNLTFEPVLTLPDNSFVTESPRVDEPKLFRHVRELVQRIYLAVTNGVAPSDNINPYGPLGFARTGGLVVLYTNCPDNTLPIIHYESSASSWHALFPRASRLNV